MERELSFFFPAESSNPLQHHACAKSSISNGYRRQLIYPLDIVIAFLTCHGDPDDDGLPFRTYPPLFTAPVSGSFWVAVALFLEPVLLILQFSTWPSPSPMTMVPDKHQPPVIQTPRPSDLLPPIITSSRVYLF
jgi:hypothetical protein